MNPVLKSSFHRYECRNDFAIITVTFFFVTINFGYNYFEELLTTIHFYTSLLLRATIGSMAHYVRLHL